MSAVLLVKQKKENEENLSYLKSERSQINITEMHQHKISTFKFTTIEKNKLKWLRKCKAAALSIFLSVFCLSCCCIMSMWQWQFTVSHTDNYTHTELGFHTHTLLTQCNTYRHTQTQTPLTSSLCTFRQSFRCSSATFSFWKSNYSPSKYALTCSRGGGGSMLRHHDYHTRRSHCHGSRRGQSSSQNKWRNSTDLLMFLWTGSKKRFLLVQNVSTDELNVFIIGFHCKSCGAGLNMPVTLEVLMCTEVFFKYLSCLF